MRNSLRSRITSFLLFDSLDNHLYGEAYRKKNKLPLHILNVMSAIEKCRTSALGGHIIICEDCGDLQISYNSCRNRHCPKYQALARERWVDNQKSNLLNVGYCRLHYSRHT